ncbi:MAG: hypothetical protein QME65_05630 [Candidatus Omnitrophota bacterium]|nr:hypothetical protein [Candidatus Omnitrophota bacterium]
MKRMTPAAKLLLGVLKGKYKYFSERRMLANDGSFYCIDKSLMGQLGIGDNTIRRARIFLKEAGEINYIVGRYKGMPTRYWVIPKGAKMEPFGEDLKGAKMAPKEANLVVEGSQIGSLNNKVLIKSENKNMPDIPFFTEEDKEGIRAFAKSYGVDETTNFLVHKGCDPVSIREILEGIEEQKYCLKS